MYKTIVNPETGRKSKKLTEKLVKNFKPVIKTVPT